MPTVLITSITMPSHDADPAVRALRNAGWELRFSPYRGDRTDVELAKLLPGIDAVIAGTDPFTETALRGADRLKLIARTGVGYDAIDIDAATRHGVAVTVTLGVNHHAVADFTLALMLACARLVVPNHTTVQAGEWQRSIGVDVFGKTVGIIGTGLIGSGVARRAHGFAMRILAYDVAPNAALTEQYGVAYVALDELLAQADFVTLHVNLNQHTRHLLGTRQFGLMKPTAYLINTCRGPVVDEAALYLALNERKIAGAGLDVFEREPPVGSPLLALPNVVLAPHVAGISQESQRAMADTACDEAIRLAQGKPLRFVVNPDVVAKGAE